MKELTNHEHMLLAKAVEGDLTQKESSELQKLLAAHPELQSELASMKSLKETTMSMKFKQPPEETWDRYWAGVYARMERGFAWLLVSIGGAILLAFGAYNAAISFMHDESIPFLIKLAIGVVALGTAILFISVLREKWFVHKSDKYREVIR